MPTADRAPFVERALACFASQTYRDRELVIVDDGNESVAGLVESWAQSSGDASEVRYVRLDRRTTIGEKRNVACGVARGALIAHWDDDDWYGPNRLARQVDAMGQSRASICGLRSLLYVAAPEGAAARYEYPADRRAWVSGNTLCFRRRVWQERPFAAIDDGEDIRFVWSRAVSSLLALPDDGWFIGTMHGLNTSGVQRRGTWWHDVPVDEVVERGGDGFVADVADRARRCHEALRLRPAGPVGPRPSRVAPPTPTVVVPARSVAVGRSVRAPVAVVVTCHGEYVPWLAGTLSTIDAQSMAAAERVLVLDGCTAPAPPGWTVVGGTFGDPSPARDAGMRACAAPWVVFWDTDNLMPPGYVASLAKRIAAVADDVAILYPDLEHRDVDGRVRGRRTMPPWDYWQARADNVVDTASAWRREALATTPWPRYVTSSHEDYALALDVTAAGWRAERAGGPAVVMRDLGFSRTRRSQASGDDLDDIWRSRSLGIVTLIAPRAATFERWHRFLHAADLPPKTSLYVVDNTGSEAFGARIVDACRDLQAARGLRSVEFIAAGVPYTSPSLRRSAGDDPERHRHVARLYQSVLPRVREDLVLTLEDDVEPGPDAVRRLGREFGWAGERRIGVVAGAYAWPALNHLVCAGRGDQTWGEAPRWADLGDGLMDVGFVGGGCAMWAGWALRRTPITFRWEAHLGWDACLCLGLRAGGHRVVLHGGVRCRHHVHGVPDVTTRP